MIKNVDHITLAVTHVEEAKKFFSLLGFEEEQSVVIQGDNFSNFMNIDNLKADHITLWLKNSTPRFEIQLLKFHTPAPQLDPHIHRLDKLGYNHLCFAVDDIHKQIHKLKDHNVKILSDVLTFHKRKLVYIEGPNGVIIELAQRES